jgi:predicted Rossmann fold flavoprotein
MSKKIVIVGGGAAGFYAAIQHKEAFPENEVLILEKSANFLQKVKISGGGRCNVTHHCFENKELIKFYPRGGKELQSVFARYAVREVINWFEKQGVRLKTEADNRMFPVTDNSATIVECFLRRAKELNINLYPNTGLKDFEAGEQIKVITEKDSFFADRLLFAAGSSAKIWHLLSEKGYEIVSPVPSLFTFIVKDEALTDHEGISVPKVIAKVKGTKLSQEGALLITHRGLSAPAVLKLSAYGARELHDAGYNFMLSVNFFPAHNPESIKDFLQDFRSENPKKQIGTVALGEIPNRLWRKLCEKAGLSPEIIWADMGKSKIAQLGETLTNCEFQVSGKNTFKEEFVTAGGVSLKNVDMRTMRSKLHENIFFAGEVLNIDAVTGGFNFQAAWSTAWLAAQSM